MNKPLGIFLLHFVSLSGAYAADQPVQELETVVVTASAPKTSNKVAKPVTELSGDKLRLKTGATLGDTLKNELGITSQSFGAGVGTPVIRGQSGSRVKVLQNSIGSNDVSSLSPDHANSVEPILVERLEVLRGPATLLYSSGAIGGIVNVIDNRIPEKLPPHLLGGAAEQRYNSASNETSSTIKLEGAKNHVAYHVDGFYRDQGNTHIGGQPIDEQSARATDFSLAGVGALNNPRGLIDNSQARSRGGSAGVSVIGDIGLVGAAINELNKNYGIPPNGAGGEPVRIDLKQTKYDFKAQLNEPLAWADKLRLKFGYTDYQHTELEGPNPATRFTNQSYESRLELDHKPLGKLNGTWGFQSVNSQFAALGAETIVPRSDINTYSLFALESLDVDAFTYKLGWRGDWQHIAPENRNSVTYVPVSGSASVDWNLTKQHQLSLAFTHSQRAPQIQELFSNGVHDATRSYELGSANLKKELSNNLDVAYRFTGERVTAELSLFHNWVSDYIYQQRLDTVYNRQLEAFEAVCSNAGECLPVLESRQTAATFRGFEAKTVLTLMQNRHGIVDLTLFGDYTRGSFNTGGNVPRLPPLRYGVELAYEKNDWASSVRFTRAEPQNHAGLHETNTSGYLLLNLSTQYRIASFHQSEVLLFAKGNNLLNENIRNSTSYLRNFAPESGRGAELGIRVNY